MEPQALDSNVSTIATVGSPPLDAETSAPLAAGTEATTPPTAASGGAAKRPTGRRRSRSFYGSENHPDPVPVTALPPRAAPARKNTGVNLAALVFQMTLKESIEKHIEQMRTDGTYEPMTVLGDVAQFDEEATEVLRKHTTVAEFKQHLTTLEGQALLKRAISFYKFFEAKEARKECFNELDFHTKCLVDDLLFHFLVDSPGNVKG